MRHATVWTAIVLSALTAAPLMAEEPEPTSCPATSSPAAAALPYSVPYKCLTKTAEGLINSPRPATTERQERIKAQLAEVETLQREIDELRRELTDSEKPEQQLLISLKCIEVNVTKRDDFGFDFAGEKKLDGFGWSMLDQVYSGFIEAMLQHDIAKVIAEPTMIAIAGREASFVSGGEVPIVGSSGQVEYKPYGNRVKFLGLITPQDRIRIELQMENTDFDASKEMVVDGKKFPGLRRRSVDTGVEIAAGETFVLRSPVETRYSEITRDDGKVEKVTSRVEQLWLIKAELCDSKDVSAPAVHRAPKRNSIGKAAR